MILIIFITLWEIICLLGDEGIEKSVKWLRGLLSKIYRKIEDRRAIKWIAAVILLAAGVIVYLFVHTTKFYTSVAEVYGIPVGIGEPLTSEEQNNCAGYWKIRKYSFRKYLILDYVEHYEQMEIMKQMEKRQYTKTMAPH